MRVVIASYLLAVCHALSIADPVVAAQPVESAASLANYEGSDREKRLLEGARKEREVNVYTSLVTEDVTNLAAAFEKKYGVKLRFWRASSENVLQRIASEARASRFDFDLVETNGPELESLHRENLLLPAKSPYDADLIPGAIPRHRAWVGTRLNMFVQAYNTSLVRKDELPKAYQDLRDPKWRGKLGIEAEDTDWFGAVVKDLGEDNGLTLFREIVATNGISVRKGHTLLAGLVASGEVPFALTVYNHNAERLKQRGAPIDWYVIQPAYVRPNGIALSRKPPHPHAALLFYDFLLSEEGQRILEKGNYVPTNLKLGHPAHLLTLKFIDSGVVLDESAKWDKLWEQIIKRGK